MSTRLAVSKDRPIRDARRPLSARKVAEAPLSRGDDECWKEGPRVGLCMHRAEREAGDDEGEGIGGSRENERRMNEEGARRGRGQAVPEGVCGSGKRHPPRKGACVGACTAHSRPRGFPFFVGCRAVEQPCAARQLSCPSPRRRHGCATRRQSDVSVPGHTIPRVNTRWLLSHSLSLSLSLFLFLSPSLSDLTRSSIRTWIEFPRGPAPWGDPAVRHDRSWELVARIHVVYYWSDLRVAAVVLSVKLATRSVNPATRRDVSSARLFWRNSRERRKDSRQQRNTRTKCETLTKGVWKKNRNQSLNVVRDSFRMRYRRESFSARVPFQFSKGFTRGEEDSVVSLKFNPHARRMKESGSTNFHEHRWSPARVLFRVARNNEQDPSRAIWSLNRISQRR